MREVAEAEVRPRFRALADGDVSSKSSPDDLVTVADVASEKALTERLYDMVDLPVVGEEAAAADPDLVEILGSVPEAWVVDPIDGTWNFVHGSAEYAVMVGLVRDGEAHGGWILHPETGDLFAAIVGEGGWITDAAGRRKALVPASGALRETKKIRGMVVAHDADPALVDRLEGAVAELTPQRGCAGWDYWDLVRGATDFLLYFRAMPWDHVPGVAISRVAGFEARYLDGSEYRADAPSQPFLVAREGEWQAIADVVNG